MDFDLKRDRYFIYKKGTYTKLLLFVYYNGSDNYGLRAYNPHDLRWEDDSYDHIVWYCNREDSLTELSKEEANKFKEHLSLVYKLRK